MRSVATKDSPGQQTISPFRIGYVQVTGTIDSVRINDKPIAINGTIFRTFAGNNRAIIANSNVFINDIMVAAQGDDVFDTSYKLIDSGHKVYINA